MQRNEYYYSPAAKQAELRKAKECDGSKDKKSIWAFGRSFGGSETSVYNLCSE